MELEIFQVDAFARRAFEGNPAAVCVLERALDEERMQAIAAENNLSETAFVTRPTEGSGGRFGIRWFTPRAEVDLCGHATLASAWVLQRFFLERPVAEVAFDSRSGELRARFRGDEVVLDFPTRAGVPAEPPRDDRGSLVDALLAGGGRQPVEVLEAPYWMAVFESEDDVRSLRPDFAHIAAFEVEVIATAPGRDVDFVSRFFAPRYGIDEDPVTGSAHCTLTPYWSQRLGKKELRARQISARGGDVTCEDRGDRTWIGGRAVLYLRGTITV